MGWVSPRPLWPLLVGALAAVACSTSDYSVLEAQTLTISPCEDGLPRTFSPFVFRADLLRWFSAENVGTIEMRAGYRPSVISDEAVLQMADLRAIVEARTSNPNQAFPLDGQALRLSLSLLETCPDQRQPIEARDGEITFTRFEPWKGGSIAGFGRFALYDRRSLEAGEKTPLVKDVTFEFAMKVRSGPPYEDFTNWPP